MLLHCHLWAECDKWCMMETKYTEERITGATNFDTNDHDRSKKPAENRLQAVCKHKQADMLLRSV
jgi:hypothetical protein